MHRFLHAAAALASLATACLALAGCPTNQSAVCQSVGDCSQGGSSDWVSSCQNEAKLLQAEAQKDGCSTQYDDYYSCAESNFTCQGTTASFPGCNAKLSALDTCINAAEPKTSCAALAAAEVGCGVVSVMDGGGASDAASMPAVDAGTSAGDGGAVVPIACSTARDCEARCYLTIVADVCAPQVNELDAFTTCASACPP